MPYHLDLEQSQSFKQWADLKRSFYEQRGRADFINVVELDAHGNFSLSAHEEIKTQVECFNFALYRLDDPEADTLSILKNMGAQLGLKELDKNLCASEDRVTQLTVKDHGRANTYIPYTNKPIGWHTDGYYNPMHQRVLAFILHCEQPAAQGGVNQLLDPDMVYIHLREQNPEFIRALSRPEVMCIPENIEDGIEIRPQTCSAVFIEEQDHALAMRFSKRKHNIIWSNDTLTQEALSCLLEFLDSDTPYHIEYRLQAGEGVINNNVLHTRSAFTDSAESKRIFYRARYYNRINMQ